MSVHHQILEFFRDHLNWPHRLPPANREHNASRAAEFCLHHRHPRNGRMDYLQLWVQKGQTKHLKSKFFKIKMFAYQNGQAMVVVCNCLRVKTDSRYRLNSLTRLQSIENGRLANRIETDHQNARLFLAKKYFEQVQKRASNAVLHGYETGVSKGFSNLDCNGVWMEPGWSLEESSIQNFKNKRNN